MMACVIMEISSAACWERLTAPPEARYQLTARTCAR